MSITRMAIEKNRITTMVLISIALGGLIAFQQIPRAKDPGFVFRWARVETDFPGAGPERVEQLVTDRLEKAIQEIPELDWISSFSKTGYSSITLKIKDRYANMRPIWDKLRRKMESVKPELPEGAIGPRVDDELGDVFGIQLALVGEGYSPAELKEVADEVRDELLYVRDVAKAVCACLGRSEALGQVYHLAADPPCTSVELFEEIKTQLDVRALRLPIAAAVLYLLCMTHELASRVTGRPNILSGDKWAELRASGWECAVQAIREDIGFTASTPLPEGIRQTIAWYRQEGRL